MSDLCPSPGPDDPLVRSLLGSVDCHVQAVVQNGYGALFQPSGAFTTALTALLTIYVALFGYRLMLGRTQLNVSELALTLVKLGAVLALATQWSVYQALVYHTLFFGPQQLADLMLHGLRASGSSFQGDVFDGLQRAFNDLSSFSPAAPPGASATAASRGELSTLLSQAGFEALLLLISAVVLLISSLGVLLACKIVLGLLLAVGPVFIAMLLFESTRGLFAGWVRASLGFAFAPIAVILLLGLGLNLLEPSLVQIEAMRQAGSYAPGVAFAVVVLVTVFAGVAGGLITAGAVIAGGLRLPGGARTAPMVMASGGAETGRAPQSPTQPRAARTASAMAAQERREATIFARAAAAPVESVERRTTVQTLSPIRGAPPAELRLGQGGRRNASPRAGRSGARSAS